MRGCQSKFSEEERLARRRAASRRAQLHRMARNLAQGLTARGSERRIRSKPPSPELQRLVRFYARRAAHAAERAAVLGPLELAWRNFRAGMGVIEVPEIKLYSCSRGADEDEKDS